MVLAPWQVRSRNRKRDLVRDGLRANGSDEASGDVAPSRDSHTGNKVSMIEHPWLSQPRVRANAREDACLHSRRRLLAILRQGQDDRTSALPKSSCGSMVQTARQL